MARSEPQLNIRSAFAREEARAIARQTGMTTTQVVEAALRAYEPPMVTPMKDDVPEGMVRKSGLLVMKAREGRTITLEDTLTAIDADREERADAVSRGY